MGTPQNGPSNAARSRDVLQTSIREAAAKAQELQRQAGAAQTSLKEATAKVQQLQQQAADAQQMIVVYQEQEGVIARALADAERATEQIIQSARAAAEETAVAAKAAAAQTMAAAKAAAEETAQSARTAAAETLRHARESAEAQAHAAERVTAAAKAEAEEIAQAARAAAEDALARARASAQEQLQAAERTTAAAKAEAEETARAARAAAEDALARARASAQEQLQAAERTTAAAKAEAEEIARAARAAAEDALARARASAQEQLQAAEHAAAEQLARLRVESDRLVEETNHEVDEVKKSAEQYVAGIAAKLETFIVDREGVSRGLETLVKKQMESLQALTRLRLELQRETLPVLNRLMRGLRGDVGPEPEIEPLEALSELPDQVDQPSAGAEETPAPETDAGGVRDPLPQHHGEIVVSPIHSFLQATKFMAALSQIKGVASVKLRSYAGSKAVIELVTEGLAIGSIDGRMIDGFPLEVVESTEERLTLRIGTSTPRPVVS
ncbi:MAG TPA: hypothetical protein VKV57_07490 [bacterium]|nr:hypothetical protein [bacterium]